MIDTPKLPASLTPVKTAAPNPLQVALQRAKPAGAVALRPQDGALSAPTARTALALDAIRAGKVRGLAPSTTGPTGSVLAAAMGGGKRPRLVFAVDATASREPAWEAARQITDALFTAVPGQLDVALAVHGGGKVRAFTPFVSNPNALRDDAAAVVCQAGQTAMLPILELACGHTAVKTLVYIGDCFEEDPEAGLRLADTLKARGTRLIVLHDTSGGGDKVEWSAAYFAAITARTGGCVLPFDASAVGRLRETLAAIAVLAVGGPQLLASQIQALPAARRLLAHLPR